MEKKLNFIKLAGKWFVHLPNYPGHYSELEMVLGADSMCDMIDAYDIGYITVIVNTEPSENQFTTKVYTLDFINSTKGADGEQDGALYKLKELDWDVWLCNVTKYLFGEFPATIYVRL